MSTTTVPTTGAGLEGVVAGESEICYIDGYAGILSYRGYNIHTLAEHATFEEVIQRTSDRCAGMIGSVIQGTDFPPFNEMSAPEVICKRGIWDPFCAGW